jgi:hypothetical protein
MPLSRSAPTAIEHCDCGTQYVGKDLGDWETYKLQNGFGLRRWRRMSDKGVSSCPRAGCGKSACPVDERNVETEPRSIQAPPDERGGNRYGQATAPHSDSTNLRPRLPASYVSSHQLRTNRGRSSATKRHMQYSNIRCTSPVTRSLRRPAIASSLECSTRSNLQSSD